MGSDTAVALHDGDSVRALAEAGDLERAYAAVVEVTQDSLYRFLRHMLRDDEAAHDAFQDTYLRVFRALRGFRGEASLTTWVLTIGRNVALNRIRHEKGTTRRTESLDDDANPPSEPAVAAVEPLMTRSVLDALDRLPAVQREVVLLFYGDDLPLQEIAAMTGRPINTLKSDLLRARQRLQALLGAPGAPAARGEVTP